MVGEDPLAAVDHEDGPRWRSSPGRTMVVRLAESLEAFLPADDESATILRTRAAGREPGASWADRA